MFCIAADTPYARYSWYLRLAMLQGGHSWTGIVRCETSAHLARDDAAAIADRTAAVLPLVASEPHVDPRAPQNLVPIGALERELRHRMGDRGLVFRALRHAVARPAIEPRSSERRRDRGAGRARPRLPALLDERVPGGARRRRLPAARRPRRRAHPGAEGRRGAHLRRRHRGRGRVRGGVVRERHAPHRRARHHAGGQGPHARRCR